MRIERDLIRSVSDPDLFDTSDAIDAVAAQVRTVAVVDFIPGVRPFLVWVWKAKEFSLFFEYLAYALNSIHLSEYGSADGIVGA